MTHQVTILRQSGQIPVFMDFVMRQKGRLGEFWLPSGMQDLICVGGGTAGTYTFTTNAFTAFNAFYQSGAVNRGVIIVLTEGRRIYRAISSVVKVGDDSQIAVSTALPFTFTPSEVIRISWMRVSRLAGDDVTLEYLTEDVMQTQLSVQSLPYIADEAQYSELDGAAQWVMDNWADHTADCYDPLDYLVNIASNPPLGV